MKYSFPIYLAGFGDTPEEAWRDACGTVAQQVIGSEMPEQYEQEFDCPTCEDTGKVWDGTIDDWREDSECPYCSAE